MYFIIYPRVEINFRLPGVTESLDEGIDPRARQKIFLKKSGCATVEDLRIKFLRSGNSASKSFPKMASKGRMEDVSYS